MPIYKSVPNAKSVDIQAKTVLQDIGKQKIVFLTGRAGTGKTTLLKELGKKVENALILAPTGVAALNSGGMTIHSFFQMDFRPYLPDDDDLRPHNIQRKFKYAKEKRQMIRQMNLLIIDEISMVKSYTIDAIDKLLRYYRKCDMPFGGLSVLMVGDLLQLPPVVSARNGEYSIIERFYDSEYFFDAKVLQESGLLYYELTTVHRQKDTKFLKLLDRIRLARHTQKDLSLLNSKLTHEIPDGYITLTTTKKKAQVINEERLEALNSPTAIFRAEVTGKFSKSDFPTSEVLELKVGAQVMMIRNARDKSYINGTIGIVCAIGNDAIDVMTERGIVTVTRDTWQKAKYVYRNGKIDTEIVGEFRQLPIILAWAINIHKSQGLTFDKVCVDCSHSFAPGQVYVALSRCRSFDGLLLKSLIGQYDIRVSERVLSFLDQFQTERYHEEDTTVDVEEEERKNNSKGFGLPLIGRLAKLFSR